MSEIVTPELKAKIYKQFEKSSQLAEEQADFIEELQRRLRVAEKVCYAAHIYIKSINSPLAMGWDALLGALGEWTKEKAERLAKESKQ